MALKPEVSAKDYSQGDANAQWTLVQYGDFECPYSGAAFGAIQEVRAKLGDKLRYVFRPFPLPDVHPHALHAAAAAEAAASQDLFWPMHDILFQNQDALTDADLTSYARQIGLDEKKFAMEMKDQTNRDRLHQSVQEGRKNGVHGTPTLFINGEFHDNDEGLWDANALLQAIENAAS